MPVNWKELIEMVAPLGGALASGKGNSGHFMSGWQHGSQIAQREREAKQLQQQQQRQKAGQFKLDMTSQLLGLDDPFVFQQMKDAAAHGGQSMFGMDPTEWNDISFPESKTASKQLKELNDLLDGMVKQGHSLDDLAQSGSSIETNDGQLIPVASAIELTRRSPISATGQRVPVPKKPLVEKTRMPAAAGSLENFAERWADAHGKNTDTLTADDVLEIRKAYSTVDDKQPDADIMGLNKTLKELQIETARARLDAPPKPEKVRNILSSDANRIAEIDTSLSDLRTLRSQIGKTGALPQLGARVPNAVTEYTGFGEGAKQRQAVIDRVKQVIGKALEGGVLRKEDEYKYVKILPTIGDPPAVVKTKLDGLEQALVQRRQITIETLTDAGFDTAASAARGESRTSPSVGTTGPKPGTLGMVNGVKAYWDGHGWLPVK